MFPLSFDEKVTMKIIIRKMGNSQGVIIPKPPLDQLGLGGTAEMTVENDALILRPPRRAARAGWAEAAEALAEAGDDTPAWPEFANEDDSAFRW